MNALVVHRPAPLVSAEVTMRGNDFYPLYFDRLRHSKWWRRASDTARARNIMMWGEAYKASPPGSLEDDDDVLAEAAGYGLDIDVFLVHKADIMGCWTLCSDGRWYHPTLCDVVLETWERKSDARKSAAVRKQAQRDRLREVTRPAANVPRDAADVTRDDASNERDIGTQDKTRQHNTGSPKADGRGAQPVEAFDAYNALAAVNDWATAERLTEGRRKKLQVRLKDYGLDGWTAALNRAAESTFLMGRAAPTPGRKVFKMDLDFLLQASSFQKLIEGKYDDGPGTDGRNGRRTEDLRALHEAAMELADPDY